MTEPLIATRDATPVDAARIAAIARASWTETYAEIFETATLRCDVRCGRWTGEAPDRA